MRGGTRRVGTSRIFAPGHGHKTRCLRYPSGRPVAGRTYCVSHPARRRAARCPAQRTEFRTRHRHETLCVAVPVGSGLHEFSHPATATKLDACGTRRAARWPAERTAFRTRHAVEPPGARPNVLSFARGTATKLDAWRSPSGRYFTNFRTRPRPQNSMLAVPVGPPGGRPSVLRFAPGTPSSRPVPGPTY